MRARVIILFVWLASIAACGDSDGGGHGADGGPERGDAGDGSVRADAGDGGSMGGDASTCDLECAAPPPGCRYEGPTSCDPPSCGTLVCTDAGPPPGPTPLSSPDDACGSNGLTPRRVLDAVGPLYETTLQMFDEATRTYGATSTPLRIEIEYAGGEILCHPPFVPCDGCGAPYVPEHVSIEVSMRFATDDGLFDERFTSVLSNDGVATMEPVVSVVSFFASVPTSTLVGGYAPRYGDEAGVAVEISGSFEGGSTMGAVHETSRPPAAAREHVNIAIWRAAP